MVGRKALPTLHFECRLRVESLHSFIQLPARCTSHSLNHAPAVDQFCFMTQFTIVDSCLLLASYIRVVKRFAGFLGRSPDTARVEDLRSYQLYLVDHGISPSSLNATLTGLKFLFETTLDHPKLLTKKDQWRSMNINGVSIQCCHLKIVDTIHRLKQTSCLGMISRGKGLGRRLMARG
jgi:hypothetical protein